MGHGAVIIPSGRLLMLSHAIQGISGLSVITVSEIIDSGGGSADHEGTDRRTEFWRGAARAWGVS